MYWLNGVNILMRINKATRLVVVKQQRMELRVMSYSPIINYRTGSFQKGLEY